MGCFRPFFVYLSKFLPKEGKQSVWLRYAFCKEEEVLKEAIERLNKMAAMLISVGTIVTIIKILLFNGINFLIDNDY